MSGKERLTKPERSTKTEQLTGTDWLTELMVDAKAEEADFGGLS